MVPIDPELPLELMLELNEPEGLLEPVLPLEPMLLMRPMLPMGSDELMEPETSTDPVELASFLTRCA